MKTRDRNESGAVAVLFAMLALVLLGVSALAIDVGQVYAKRSALQSNVDLAVLAATAELTSGGACNPEVAAAAKAYLEKDANAVPDQVALNLGGSAGDGNGFIRCNNWKVELWAPTAKVEYGLARAVMDEETADEGIDVPAYAAAQIKSPGQTDTLPMYSVSGCDTGSQVIKEPPPGHSTPSDEAPPMIPAGGAAIRDVTITPTKVASDLVEPQGPVTVSGQIRGTGSRTGQIAFYNPTAGTTVLAGVASALPSGGGWNNFTLTTTTIPQTVLDVDGIWWVRVRVRTGTAVDWSPDSESAPFLVGELLFCGGVVNGNFGTLDLARTDVPAGSFLAMNIIKGAQPFLTTNPSNVVPCSPVESRITPVSPTDCVATLTGFKPSSATAGLVDGDRGEKGRLDHPTTPNCDRNGGSDLTSSAPNLNDDLLTCYILGGHSVNDVVSGVPNILSADILNSPRFFYIPVLPVAPSSGASGAYPIVGFRPGFITAESLSATADARGAISGHNGLTFHSGKVEELTVILFPESALPKTAPPRGGEVDYTGSGIKVLVLVE